VQFYNGSKAIGAPALVTAGVATLSSAGALTVGTDTFRARFLPSTTVFATSLSAGVALKVVKAVAVIKTVATKVKVAGKTRVALVVTVRAAGLVPTGRITIYKLVKKAYVRIRIVTLVRGRVVVVLPVLRKGTYVFRTLYGGSTLVGSALTSVRFKV
jgi:hypothetical protein